MATKMYEWRADNYFIKDKEYLSYHDKLYWKKKIQLHGELSTMYYKIVQQLFRQHSGIFKSVLSSTLIC